jgi:hypothetical protein
LGDRDRSLVKKIVVAGCVTQFIVWVAAMNALAPESGSTSTSTPTAPSPSATTSAPPAPDPTSTISAEPGSVLKAALELKVIEDDHEPDPDSYSRDEFGQKWADVDRNGCDQRNDVLRRDLVKLHTKPGTNGCVVARGVLKESSYSGDRVKFATGETKIDIDHVVALADAWRMGASEWKSAKRAQFANDPLNLLAVDRDENQEKNDASAARWTPTWDPDAECDFLVRHVTIKTKYHLAVADQERYAFITSLGTSECDGNYREPLSGRNSDVKIPKPKPIGEPKPKPKPEPEPRQTQEPKPDRNVYYKNCDAVRAAGADPIHRGDPGYARHLDRDGDGVGCE